jgi:WD40 repeat protein
MDTNISQLQISHGNRIPGTFISRAFLGFVALWLLLSWSHGLAQSDGRSVAHSPILYFDVEDRDLVIRAVHPDGSPAGTPAHGQLAGWSAQGDRLAYLTKDNVSVNLMRLDGQPETIFKANPGETVFLSGWQSIWSPDGKRVALLLARADSVRTGTFSLAIVDIEKREVANRFELPQSAYTRNGMPMNWPPYNLKWSPDGRKILLAWEQALILDVERKILETAIPRPVMAEWAASNSVYYFDELFAVGSLLIKETGQKEAVKVFDRSQLNGWGMVQTLLLHAPLLKLHPSGTRLAMAAGTGRGAKSTVLVFNVHPTRPGALESPAQSLQVDAAILAMEWGPDRKTLALLAGSEEGLTIRVLNLETGTAKTLARLTELKGPDIDLVGLMNTISWAP